MHLNFVLCHFYQIFANNKKVILIKQMILTYQSVLCFLPFLGPVIAIIALIILICSKPNKKTQRIAILGMKASGKTTLWNGLRDETYSSYKITAKKDTAKKDTAKEEIKNFTIEKDGKEVTIVEGTDIGGGDGWVLHYDYLIQDGTFIFFLVDATYKTSDSRRAIRARVQKVFELMKSKDNCGARILITHKDQCTGMQDGEIINTIKEWLDLESVKVNGKTAKYEYIAVDLTNHSDISRIKDLIIDNVYG